MGVVATLVCLGARRTRGRAPVAEAQKLRGVARRTSEVVSERCSGVVFRLRAVDEFGNDLHEFIEDLTVTRGCAFLLFFAGGGVVACVGQFGLTAAVVLK